MLSSIARIAWSAFAETRTHPICRVARCTTVRRFAVLITLALAALCSALFARAGSAHDATSFRTPDAGAACRVVGPALVCSSLASEGSLALRSSGAPRVARGLPWWDASTPVLKTFHRGAVSCHLAGNTLLCLNHDTAVSLTRAGFAVAL